MGVPRERRWLPPYAPARDRIQAAMACHAAVRLIAGRSARMSVSAPNPQR
jgi:hypothetical protein